MEYRECLVELDEVLNYLGEEELQKIPSKLVYAIKEKMDKNYKWKYDESKELYEQNLNRKTIAMLSYLNMKYLVNDEQRELLDKIHKFNERASDEKKREQYNVNNLFKDNKSNEYKENNYKENNYKENEMALQKYSENKWYKKILLFIKNIFKK